METLEFPSESEITASSALLSLSSSTQKSSTTNYCFISSIYTPSSSSSSRFNNGIKKIFNNSRNEEAKNKSSSFISDSKSDSSSALTTTNYEEAANIISSEDSVSPTSDNPLRFLSVAANFNELSNLKVVKKSRTKMYKICDIQNKNYRAAAVAPLKETSRSESATSTVSSETSVVSRQSYAFDRSCHTARKKIRMMMKKRRRIMMTTPPESPDNNVINASIPSSRPSPELLVIPSAYILRRAEAILKVLSDNTAASETEIRQVLGDNPTTSKALRLLLKGKAVKRSGAGGSRDPYVYMIIKGASSRDIWRRRPQ